MICRDPLEPGDDRCETVGQIQHLAVNSVIGGRASEAGDVLDRRLGPVVDDEKRKQSGTNRVEPPQVCFVANDGEEKGEGVEVYVSFAVFWRGVSVLVSLTR